MPLQHQAPNPPIPEELLHGHRTAPHWFTGISVAYAYAGSDRYGWTASISFTDGAHCTGDEAGQPISTGGTLSTTYAVVDDDPARALAAAVDAVLTDAAALGAQPRCILGRAMPLYTDGRGWGSDFNPAGDLTQRQAQILVRDLSEQRGWAPPVAA